MLPVNLFTRGTPSIYSYTELLYLLPYVVSLDIIRTHDDRLSKIWSIESNCSTIAKISPAIFDKGSSFFLSFCYVANINDFIFIFKILLLIIV